MANDPDEVRSGADELLDAGAHDRLDTMRHSAAHIMAAAVLDLFPDAKLGIGPAIRDGFYYDFDLPRALTPADLEQIEERMQSQVRAELPFERSELDRSGALEMLDGQHQDYKVEIIRDLPPEQSEIVSFYRHGDFIDLCRGPHLDSTAKLGPFKLLSSAGAYWRGDEKRPMLQRIYGTVWEDQEDLDRYLWRMEEARKRDHRRLGRDLDLFTFHPESPAAPFWHPRGMALFRALEDWSRQVRREGGFDEVRTPTLVRRELWEQSGHWELYQDNMFVLDDYDHPSGMKPMNCPEEILIYKTRSRSYRELPLRFADYSVLMRKELTGALSGMFRVRQLVQDDSHVFCREDQVPDELALALRLVKRQYEPFGFEPTFKLATRPEKRLGSDEFWDMAEGKLRDALEAAQVSYTMDPGGAAFYAPKIDVFIEDALGREWQMATIQLDYQLPQRFDLDYRAGRWRLRATGDDPLRHLWLVRALRGRDHRALRRRLPPLARPAAGHGGADRRPAHRVRHARAGGAGGSRPSGGGRRSFGADAGQAARCAGAEGPGHGGGRRPRPGGRRRVAAAAHRRVAAGSRARRVRGRPARTRRPAGAVALRRRVIALLPRTTGGRGTWRLWAGSSAIYDRWSC